MAGDWAQMELGDTVDFLSGGTPSKDRGDMWKGSIPWVSAKDMKRLRLDEAEDHVSEDAIGNGTRLVPAGTVLILTRGMTLLNDIPICVLKRPMAFNQDVKAIRPKPRLAPEYVPYLFLGNKERLLSLVDLAGHGTGRLNTDELKALRVVLPPIGEQRAIAHILGTLDDKIELNRRMSETLEAMARALFKSWFVDFEPVRAKAEGRETELPRDVASLFPNSFDETDLGPLPAGWRTRKLGEAVSLTRGTTYKSSLKDLPGPVLLGLSSIARDGGFREDKLSTYGGESPSHLLVKPGDIYVSLKDVTQSGDLLGSVARLPRHIGAGRLTQDTVRLDFRTPGFSREIVYRTLLSSEYRDYCRSCATGTTNLGLNRESFLAYSIVVPSKEVALAFEQIVGRIQARIEMALENGRGLIAIRNAILPRLVSGDLRTSSRLELQERRPL